MNARDRLIVALDADTETGALELVEKLRGEVGFFKIGFELFSSCGPAIVGKVAGSGGRIFLDLKYHDIPNTVSKAAVAVTRLGVSMFNLHALGGFEMMRGAVEAVAKEASRLRIERPKLLAVTVLTSMDENALKKVGINDTMDSEVLRLAHLAKSAGMDGIVASVAEAGRIRKELGPGFLIVTPGVRPAWADAGDQKRIATPKGAIEAGVDYIVVGRPITGAADPAGAARRIIEEMEP